MELARLLVILLSYGIFRATFIIPYKPLLEFHCRLAFTCRMPVLFTVYLCV